MRRERKSADGAFTLIEILVVIAIIGILGSVAVVKYMSYLSSSKINTAKMQVLEIGENVHMYSMTVQKYPESFDEMVHPEDGNAAVLSKIPVDPWGNQLVYELSDDQTHPFELKSLGPDGEDGTEDDIDYWTIKEDSAESEGSTSAK
jgi:general secretion pathway protein G